MYLRLRCMHDLHPTNTRHRNNAGLLWTTGCVAGPTLAQCLIFVGCRPPGVTVYAACCAHVTCQEYPTPTTSYVIGLFVIFHSWKCLQFITRHIGKKQVGLAVSTINLLIINTYLFHKSTIITKHVMDIDAYYTVNYAVEFVSRHTPV